MRICLVCQDYPAPGVEFGGGLGSGIYLLAHALCRQGHQVHVIARAARGTPERRLSDGPVRLYLVKHLPVPIPGVRYAAFLASYSLRVARAIRAIARADGLDVVEAPEFGAEGWWYGRRPELPLLVRVHTPLPLLVELSDLRPSRDFPLVCAMERAGIRQAHYLTTTSRYVAAETERLHGIPASRLEVLPPGINTAHFRPTPSDWRARLGLGAAPAVLYAGRLEWRKGVQSLVAAWPGVLRRHPQARLLLAGGDSTTAPGGTSLRAYLERQIAEQGCGASVSFLGRIDYQAMPALYSMADVVAAPSRAEPFGLVYPEALACGRATLGCHTGGAAEIISHGVDGLLVAPDSPPALAAALDQLLASAELRERLGAAGMATVRRRLSVEAFADGSVAAYERTIAAFGRGSLAPAGSTRRLPGG